jgi:hypothetical protein
LPYHGFYLGVIHVTQIESHHQRRVGRLNIAQPWWRLFLQKTQKRENPMMRSQSNLFAEVYE